MNGEQIEHALKHCKPRFSGVYACDTLPKKGKGLLVVNTDPIKKPGLHWVAMRLDKRNGEYFDSLARKPSGILREYMDDCCESWCFNGRQLQSVASRFCGHYCVYYCMLSCRGCRMTEIVKNFTDDTGFNDVLVHGFVCRHLND